MRVLVSGSTGFIGSALCGALRGEGHAIIRLLRGNVPDHHEGVRWDPSSLEPICDPRLEDIDAVVHLAGENIAGRWTRAKKRRILDSRVRGTESLAATLSALDGRPPVFLCASGVGYYGDTGQRIVDETAVPGEGFLADVCRQWENAAEKVSDLGVRVVRMRLGMILDASGGALARMLPPFRIGLGGRIGNGRQLMSWIDLEDAVHAILHAMKNRDVSGPVNMTAPCPVTNLDFTKALGNALHRPTLLPLPATAVGLLLGEMGSSLLLGSIGARPGVLTKTGFVFASETLDRALARALRAS